MEEGEPQIVFLIAKIISFLSRNGSIKYIKIIEPCWVLISTVINQVLDWIAKAEKRFVHLFLSGLLPFLLNFKCLFTPLENTGFD